MKKLLLFFLMISVLLVASCDKDTLPGQEGSADTEQPENPEQPTEPEQPSEPEQPEDSNGAVIDDLSKLPGNWN